MCVLSVSFNTLNAQDIGRSIAENEILDLILMDGDMEYGIVQAGKLNDTYCVYQSDLFSLLGYERKSSSKECLTENEIDELLNLKVSIDISKMRLLLQSNQTYPSLDMVRARQRHQSNLNNQQVDIPIVRIHDSLFPKFTGVGIDIGQSNFNHLDYSKFSSGVQVLGGNFTSNVFYTNTAPKTMGNRFQFENQWRWFSANNSNIIQNINLGNSIGWTLSQKPYDGLYVSNKKNDRTTLSRAFDMGFPLERGSIVEWYSSASKGFQSVLVTDPIDQIPLDLNYGLNTLNIRLTEPGSNTKEMTRTFYIPNGLIPKGKTEYELKLGRPINEPSKWVFGANLEHGLTHKLNVIVQLEQDHLNWNSTMNRIGVRAILLDKMDVIGKVNSRFEYDIHLGHRSTSAFNFSLTDANYSLNNQRFTNEYKRFSQLQWSLNLSKDVSIQGMADRRAFAFSKEYNSTISASRNWRYFLTRSQFSLRTIHFGQNINSKTMNSRFYMGRRINRNYVFSLESQLSHQLKTSIESITLRTQYYGSRLSLQSSIVRLPALNNTLVQFGIRNLGRYVVSNHNVHYSSNEIQHWSMYSSKWGVLSNDTWVNTSTSSMDWVGINFVAFHDENRNGIQDKNESTLTGLRGSSAGTRPVEKNLNSKSMLLTDMIPKNNYWIVFEEELQDHHELTVINPKILIQAPSSGIGTMFVPCVLTEELTGNWFSNDYVISANEINVVLHDEGTGNKYQIELFNDQTWIANRIPRGQYTLVAEKKNGEKLKINPIRLDVPNNGSERDLKLEFDRA